MFKKIIKAAGCLVAVFALSFVSVTIWGRWHQPQAGRSAEEVSGFSDAAGQRALRGTDRSQTGNAGERRWDPCDTITWSYHPGPGSFSDNDTADLISDVTAEVAALTGLHLERRGPQEKTAITWGWSDAKPPTAHMLAKTLSHNVFGTTRMHDAHISLYAQHITGWATGTDSLKAVILHELGHAVGLGHEQDDTSIMTAELAPDKPTELDEHDRERFALVGGRCKRATL